MVLPNLYVAAHSLVTPRNWLSRQHRPKLDKSVAVPGLPLALTEHWSSPVPGIYRHNPGSGWYLIQLDSDPSKPKTPERVLFCAPLDRGILESEYHARSFKTKLPKDCAPSASRSSSPSGKRSIRASPAMSRQNSHDESLDQPEVNFVCHHDGVTWLNDKNADGIPTKGPWQRFCIDKRTGEMRVMLKGDDPKLKEKRSYTSSNYSSSDSSSLRTSSSKSVASSIRAIAPELDRLAEEPSFLGPRSLHGSARASPMGSPAMSRRNSLHRPKQTSPLVSSPLPSEEAS